MKEINKKVLLMGEKGDTGDAGVDTTIPTNGLIAIEGDIPDGYVLYEEVEDTSNE